METKSQLVLQQDELQQQIKDFLQLKDTLEKGLRMLAQRTAAMEKESMAAQQPENSSRVEDLDEEAPDNQESCTSNASDDSAKQSTLPHTREVPQDFSTRSVNGVGF